MLSSVGMLRAANSETMATLLRVLLLGIVILMPGGLLVLPFLAMHQVKSAKKQNLSGREQTPLAIT